MNTKQRLLYYKEFGFRFSSEVFLRQLCINKHLVPYMRGTDTKDPETLTARLYEWMRYYEASL